MVVSGEKRWRRGVVLILVRAVHDVDKKDPTFWLRLAGAVYGEVSSIRAI